MSLKFFHIGFIGFCTLFSLGFAAWCLFAPGLPGMFQLMGWLSLVGGITLFVYGIRFLKKAKDVIV
ncbi:MAG: hypothetical protein P1U87_16810 [Verrucomicrobiales bacterium]|nr:hypothetical protein [Verrucomicrobiales bacterium]